VLYKNREVAYEAYREAPDHFFERYHERWFNEKDLISPEWQWHETKYHYNLVENGIIDLLRGRFSTITGKAVLDVGSGTGHWVDFYHRYLDASEVVGTDFSKICVQALTHRYEGTADIEVIKADISERNTTFNNRFDVINAIGVMFHLVDDSLWERAVENLLGYLAEDGIAIIGGEFGPETREMGVMRKHRSLNRWKECLASLGGDVVEVRFHDWFKGGVNDGLKNNLLAFVKV
jgi:SAM-dependent methyltransferase